MPVRAVIRRWDEGRWYGFLPRVNRTGNWPQRTWAFWTWDHMPHPAAKSICTEVDYLRGGDRLNPARGVTLGLALSAPFWLGLALLAWWLA